MSLWRWFKKQDRIVKTIEKSDDKYRIIVEQKRPTGRWCEVEIRVFQNDRQIMENTFMMNASAELTFNCIRRK